CRQRCQPEGIPIGARLLGLDRASAQTELERRQAKARRHQQAGRSLSTRPVHDRRTGRDPLRQGSRRQAPAMAQSLARRPTKVAAIALANKIARMAWAMMARGEHYREPIALAA